jgi:type VI secretion system secreted protein Hcp
VVDEGLQHESFSLKYAAVQWKYTQQKVGGNQGGNAQGAWSLTKNDKTYSV